MVDLLGTLMFVYFCLRLGLSVSACFLVTSCGLLVHSDFDYF